MRAQDEAEARSAMADWLAAVMASSEAKGRERRRVRQAIRELGHTPYMGRSTL